MKILVAGPGTGKTTRVKEIINNGYESSNVQVLSFTNATVNDLTDSFKDYSNVSCSTLHSYALKINHLPELHILDDSEIKTLKKLSEKLEIDFDTICSLLQCITFDNMIKGCISFIKGNPTYAEEKIGYLDLLIVDEFQDFNPFEQELVHLMSSMAGETFILGDDDQSIYSFKDADPEGIISLYNSGIDKLEHRNICYRCPDVVVDYASKIISKNSNRILKDWIPSSKEGILVKEQTKTQHETNQLVIDIIKEIREVDQNGSILILSPVEFAVRTLKANLLNETIKYNDCWNKKIDDEVLYKVWWLRFFLSDYKILNLLFISKSLRLFSNKKFIELLNEFFHTNIRSDELIPRILEFKVIKEVYEKYFPGEDSDIENVLDHPDFDDIKSFIDPDKIQESLKSIIQLIHPRVDFQKGSINLMSIHKSKGLQSEYVIMLGLVNGIIPNKTYGIDTIEAQRRLLFVGLTRALKGLYIVSSMEWDGSDVHKVDKTQFKFAHWRKTAKKKYVGKVSEFLED